MTQLRNKAFHQSFSFSKTMSKILFFLSFLFIFYSILSFIFSILISNDSDFVFIVHIPFEISAHIFC
jgi:hypothetical protein